MEKLSMCRICLSDHSPLHLIVNTYFQEIYESLTLTPLVTEDSRPVQVCYLCCAKLDTSYMLRRRCLQSETMFTQLLKCNVQVKLQIMPNTHPSLADVGRMTPEVFDDEVKQEVAEVSDSDDEAEAELRSIIKVEDDGFPNSDDEAELRSVIKVEDDGIPNLEDDTGPRIQEDATPKDDDTESSASEGALSLVVEKTEQGDVTARVPVSKTHQRVAQTPHEAEPGADRKQSEQTKVGEMQSKAKQTVGEKPHICNVCKKSFRRRYHLTLHIRTHTGEKPYNCNVCKKSFSYMKIFTRHNRTHTEEKLYNCNVCKKSFRQRNNLTRHNRIHIGEKPYNCDVCRKGFTVKHNLLNHIRTHTGEKPYTCDVCKKCFSIKSDLIPHIRTHTGEKPYNCDVCRKGFSQQTHLISHIRTHTGEKPYNCNVCKKSFRRRNYLTIHNRTHTGEKPYNCDVCRKCFTAKHKLLNHIRTHTGEKPYNCDVCRKCFTAKHKLLNHIRTHTGAEPNAAACSAAASGSGRTATQ